MSSVKGPKTSLLADIQNEMLCINDLKYFERYISEAKYQTNGLLPWSDEITDLSNDEHKVFRLRHVDDQLDVHEEVIGLHSLKSTSDDMLQLNLRMDNCPGQCYNGECFDRASNVWS